MDVFGNVRGIIQIPHAPTIQAIDNCAFNILFVYSLYVSTKFQLCFDSLFNENVL